MRRLRRHTPLAIAAAAALALAIAGLLSASSRSGSGGAGTGAGETSTPAPGFDGAALPQGVLAPGFTLTDESGARVSLSQFRGTVTVVSFLYAGCSPACVLIAQQIRGALDRLADPVPVLFLSVDPARDTPARVAAFLADVSLTGRVRYLTGPRAALAAVWRAYDVRTPDTGRAAFERAASVMLIDARGEERVLFGQEQLTPEALAHDIGRLQGG
jgi:protein SCO1/2